MSWVVPSTEVWVEIELSSDWFEAGLECILTFPVSVEIELIEVEIDGILTFPAGGWVAGSNGNKATSALVWVKLSWGWA